MRLHRKGFHLTIGWLVTIIIAIIFLLLVGLPWIAKLRDQVKTIYECPGQCMDDCPDDYRYYSGGDADCREKGSGKFCCQKLSQGSGIIASSSDVQLHYQGSKEALPNGASVTLEPESRGDEYWAEGKFTLKLSDEVESKKCYWQVGSVDWDENVLYCSSASVYGGHDDIDKHLFPDLLRTHWWFTEDPAREGVCERSGKDTLKDLKSCEEFAGTSLIKLGADQGLDRTMFLRYLGERVKMTLFVVDPESCEEDEKVDFCDSYAHTVHVQVPDRRAQISLERNRAPVSKRSTTQLEVGDSNTFQLLIDEPLTHCSFNYTIPLENIGEPQDPDVLALTGALANLQERFEEEESCFGPRLEERFTLTYDEEVVRAIPIDLTFTTWLDLSKLSEAERRYIEERQVTATYRLQIAPERRVRVEGPAPGLQREKQVHIGCDEVACTGKFEVAYTENPLVCSEAFADEKLAFQQVNVTPYASGASGQWRYTIQTEEHNGEYVCVKATTKEKGEHIYSLGLWNEVPQPVAIDRTPPLLSLDWDSWRGELAMTCTDPVTENGGQPYTSGCPERPFSYAFITDPLKFIFHVVTGGTLANTWSGCPDPVEGSWAMLNRDDGIYRYVAPGNDIRVICIKAEDNAGNWDQGSRILYSSQEVLAGLMTACARNPDDCKVPS